MSELKVAQLREQYVILEPGCAVRETGGLRAIFLHVDGSIVHRPVILWVLTERSLFEGYRRDNAPADIEDEDLPMAFLQWKHIQTSPPEMMGFVENGDSITCVNSGLSHPEHADSFHFLLYAQHVETLRRKLLRNSGLPKADHSEFDLSEAQKELFESSLRRLEGAGWR